MLWMSYKNHLFSLPYPSWCPSIEHVSLWSIFSNACIFEFHSPFPYVHIYANVSKWWKKSQISKYNAQLQTHKIHVEIQLNTNIQICTHIAMKAKTIVLSLNTLCTMYNFLQHKVKSESLSQVSLYMRIMQWFINWCGNKNITKPLRSCNVKVHAVAKHGHLLFICWAKVDEPRCLKGGGWFLSTMQNGFVDTWVSTPIWRVWGQEGFCARTGNMEGSSTSSWWNNEVTCTLGGGGGVMSQGHCPPPYTHTHIHGSLTCWMGGGARKHVGLVGVYKVLQWERQERGRQVQQWCWQSHHQPLGQHPLCNECYEGHMVDLR